MSSESHQAAGVSGKSKRRATDTDEDGRPIGSEEYAAQPKRQRVSRACDSCRSKKDKCDGVQPVCSTCASLCRPCTYKANPKKRGLPTGYIRTLELMWGLVFQKIQGSEDVVRALIRSVNLPSHLATMGKEAEGSDTLLASFKNSTVLRDIERMLAILEQPEEEKERMLQASTEDDTPLDVEAILSPLEVREWQIPGGLDAHGNPLLAGVSPSRTSTVSTTLRHPRSRSTRDCGVQTTPTDSASDENYPPLSLDSEAQAILSKVPLQLPYNAWPLLDIYFSYTQCWFPILEKHDILRTAFQYTEGEIYEIPSDPGSGDHAALWAVLTLASLQDASIAVTRQWDDRSNVRLDPSRMYTIARNLIPSEDSPYEFGHLQALLILSLIKLGQQDWTAAWVLIGHAVRIAQALGLDQPSSFSSSKPPEQTKHLGRARHVFLGCFVLETLIAQQTGQCPSLRKEDLVRVGSVNEDGLEEWHPWEDQTELRPAQSSRASLHRGPLQALSTFNHLVSLVSILNELCCYNQNSNVPRAQLETLGLQLQRWTAELPKSYHVDLQSRPVRLASPHNFGLEMTYESISAAVSLQLALHEHDQDIRGLPHQNRSAESAQRLLQLVQVYMETYSFSATAPTFGTLVRLFAKEPGLELDSDLRNKLRGLSSYLSSLWSIRDRRSSGQPLHISTSTVPQQPDILPSEGSALQSVSSRHAPSHQPLPPNKGHGPQSNPNPSAVASDSIFSTPWLRATQNFDDSASLLPTQTPSLTLVGGASEISAQPGQLEGGIGESLRHSGAAPSEPQRGSTILPELSTPFSPTGQYAPSYQDSSLGLGPLVDMDAYGALRRRPIAPDLDALFDELASLDGAEKADNYPEFMQNLGFISDSGLPELYSFAGQIEPFLLAQTQQYPGNGASSLLRRESQTMDISAASDR